MTGRARAIHSLKIMLRMAVYTDFPAPRNALFSAEKVFAERDAAWHP
jgi:hypothetical protein